MENRWEKGRLFFGMTNDGLKLGTVLSLGWFWMRREGCLALHRSYEGVDFENIVSVYDRQETLLKVPEYSGHEPLGRYVYAIRSVSGAGLEESSGRSRCLVRFDADGNLEKARPNCVFEISAKQVGERKAEVGWYYYPLNQQERVKSFTVYGDGGPWKVKYSGIGKYSIMVDVVEAGECRFSVLAVGENLMVSLEKRVTVQIGDGQTGGTAQISCESI